MNTQAERILDGDTPQLPENERLKNWRLGLKLTRELRSVISDLRADFIGIFMPTAEKIGPRERMRRFALARRLAREILELDGDFRGLAEDLARLENRAEKFAEAQGLD